MMSVQAHQGGRTIRRGNGKRCRASLRRLCRCRWPAAPGASTAPRPADAADEDDADDLLAPPLNSCLPRADLLVIANTCVWTQWHADGDIDIGDAPSPMHALVAAGANRSGARQPQRPAITPTCCSGPAGQTHTWPWQAPPDPQRRRRRHSATLPSPPCWRAGLEMPEAVRRGHWRMPTRYWPPASLLGMGRRISNPGFNAQCKPLRFPLACGVARNGTTPNACCRPCAKLPKVACAPTTAPQEHAGLGALPNRRARLLPLRAKLGVVFLINDDWRWRWTSAPTAPRRPRTTTWRIARSGPRPDPGQLQLTTTDRRPRTAGRRRRLPSPSAPCSHRPSSQTPCARRCRC